MSKEKTLWVHKYQPKKLSQFVGNDELKENFAKYIEENDIPHMLLYGVQGCGKTSLAELLVDQLDCEYIIINASDNRGIDTIRGQIKGFASAGTFKPLKVVILDEADGLMMGAQDSLRHIITTFQLTTRFILTANYKDRIIGPLQSRCPPLKIEPQSKAAIAQSISEILDKENIEYKLDDLKEIIVQFYPDMRLMINVAQSSSKTGVLKLNKNLMTSTHYLKDIVDELQGGNDWRLIRQIIADAKVTDFENLFRYLFDEAENYAPGKEGSIATLITKHQYEANFRVDKEINIMSLINEIIKLNK